MKFLKKFANIVMIHELFLRKLFLYDIVKRVSRIQSPFSLPLAFLSFSFSPSDTHTHTQWAQCEREALRRQGAIRWPGAEAGVGGSERGPQAMGLIRVWPGSSHWRRNSINSWQALTLLWAQRQQWSLAGSCHTALLLWRQPAVQRDQTEARQHTRRIY